MRKYALCFICFEYKFLNLEILYCQFLQKLHNLTCKCKSLFILLPLGSDMFSYLRELNCLLELCITIYLKSFYIIELMVCPGYCVFPSWMSFSSSISSFQVVPPSSPSPSIFWHPPPTFSSHFLCFPPFLLFLSFSICFFFGFCYPRSVVLPGQWKQYDLSAQRLIFPRKNSICARHVHAHKPQRRLYI